MFRSNPDFYQNLAKYNEMEKDKQNLSPKQWFEKWFTITVDGNQVKPILNRFSDYFDGDELYPILNRLPGLSNAGFLVSEDLNYLWNENGNDPYWMEWENFFP